MKPGRHVMVRGFVVISILSTFTAGAQDRGPSLPARSPTVPFEVVDKGNTQRQEGGFVIRNESQWTDLWKDLHGQWSNKPTAPKIEFDKEMILAIVVGPKNDGGYAVEIEQITYGPNDLLVRARQRRLGGAATQAFTSPYVIVKTERIDMPVRFEVQPLDEPGSKSSLADQWKGATSGAARGEVLAVVTQMYKHLGAGDWKGFDDYFVPGAIILAAQSAERDRSGVRVYSVGEWIAQIGSRDKNRDAFGGKLLNQEVHTYRDLAQVWAQIETGKDSSDAKGGPARIDALILRRVDGRWRIASLACGQEQQ